MTKIKRTTSHDSDFETLVHLLDKDLAIRNGDTDAFYAQFNKIDTIKHAIVYYDNDVAIGCGAFKEFDAQSVEVKRMYVKPEFRGRRIGAAILKALEQWANELNYTDCVLETGKTNPEALHLYQKEGYTIIPNYGQYKDVENSVCFKKNLH
jgi:GNAT superfamily N-acetyltransferase